MLTSTNQSDNTSNSNSEAHIPSGLKQNNYKAKQENIDDGLIEYTDALEAIDENNPLAEINAVSISDRNGGRIFF